MATSTSPQRDALQEQHLRLPVTLQSSSLLPWDGIATVASELRLSPGGLLLDLACGRGGYGFEVARRTGARLLGVDFSAVALDEARRHVGDVDASFVTGELTAIPQPDQSVDAVMCVDAIQFAEPRAAALAETRRVLVPGGRAVLTCWEPRSGDEGLPERLRGIDLATELEQAGYAEVQVTEQPGWHSQERAFWHAALAEDAGDDPAIHSLQQEATRVVQAETLVRRILATATR